MQQALLLLHMYASVDETKGMNSRYPALGNNFIEAAVQFLVEEVPVPEPGSASSFTFVTGRCAIPPICLTSEQLTQFSQAATSVRGDARVPASSGEND
jgi:hypothetical protein